MIRVALAAPLPDKRVQFCVSCVNATTDPSSGRASLGGFLDPPPSSAPVTSLAAAPLPDGRLQLWAATTDGGLFTTWKTTTDPDAAWADWTAFTLGGTGPTTPVTSLTAAPLPDGRLQLWVGTTLTTGGLFTTWESSTDPSAGWADWTAFAPGGGPTAAVTSLIAAPLPDGRLQLWAASTDGGLFTTWKSSTDPNALWAAWSAFRLGGDKPADAITSLTAAPLPDGRLQLWAVTTDGGLFTTWKTSTDPNAVWVGWTAWSDFVVTVV
jgi:hypothetical protein